MSAAETWDRFEAGLPARDDAEAAEFARLDEHRQWQEAGFAWNYGDGPSGAIEEEAFAGFARDAREEAS